MAAKMAKGGVRVEAAGAAGKPAKPPRKAKTPKAKGAPAPAAQGSRWLMEAAMAEPRPRILCADGTSLSAQAGEFAYCYPRSNEGPWASVEAGFPSVAMPEIMPWAEEPDHPTGTVYPRVPIGVLAAAIAARGGRADSMDGWRRRVARIAAAMEELGAPGGAGASRADGAPPAGVVDFGDRPAALAACRRWIQAAVLGSPEEERAARFDARVGASVEPWAGCMGALARADWLLEAGGLDAGAGLEELWARSLAMALELREIGDASADGAPARSKPRI